MVRLSIDVHIVGELNFINSWLKERDGMRPRTNLLCFVIPFRKADNSLLEEKIWSMKSLLHPVQWTLQQKLVELQIFCSYFNNIYNFLDFHRGKGLFCRLLSFGTVQPCRFIPTFQRKKLSSFWWQKFYQSFTFSDPMVVSSLPFSCFPLATFPATRLHARTASL